MFQHCPHQRHRPASIDHRNAHQAVLPPQLRGVQRQPQPIVAPVCQGLLNQGPVQFGGLDALIVQPPGKAAHRALRIPRLAMYHGGPCRQTDLLRQQQAGYHPGQCVHMPDIHPPPTLAQYCHQGFIYPRRVFHISSPVTGMAESIPQSAPLGNTPSNLFCQSTSYMD